MTREEIVAFRADIGIEIERRRGQGGYGVDAPSILNIYQLLHMLMGHTLEQDATIASLTAQIEKLKKK